MYNDSSWYSRNFNLTVNVTCEDGGNPEGAEIVLDGANCYYEGLIYDGTADSDGIGLFSEVEYGTYKITVSKPGYHTAVVEDVYLNQDSTVNVELKVFYDGLEDKNELENISVYPNPANNQLTIESSSEIEKIELINLVGKTIFEKQSASLSEKINTSELNPGLYFIRIKTEKGLVNRRVILSEK